MIDVKADCRHYVGEKPCGFAETCHGCSDFAPMGTRILVIKLAAIGDVLRTTPLLGPLARRYQPCSITWLTDPGAATLLRSCGGIDRLLIYDGAAPLILTTQAFDLVICLDKEPRATALATRVSASTKMGFGMNREGNLTCLNEEAGYALRLGLSDELKFKENRKSYQRIALETIGMGEELVDEYAFRPASDEVEEARRQLRQSGAPDGTLLVGLNTGCGPVFATKKWTEEGFLELAERLASMESVTPVLLGGPDERERNRRIATACKRRNLPLVDTGCDNGLRRFAALVAALDLLVTGDTLALHLAIAARVPPVLLMGSTSATEIELYGRGAMIVTDFDCAPCYRKVCPIPVSCMEALSAENVWSCVTKQISSLRQAEDLR